MTRAMKDSGVEWIGEIPKSWSTKKLKFCSNIITGNTPSKSNYDSYYSENGILWVKPDDLNDFVPITNTKEKLTKLGSGIAKIVPEETSLICCIGSIGKLGFSNQKVAFNQQINAVCFNTSIVNKKFGFYFLYTQESQHNFYANGNVLKILNSENHKRIQIPAPPLPEQQAIADYLDDKCAQIDNITATINEQIEVLKQYKKSVITEAVTKGLDPNAPMKDSGVEWIGQIPEKWEIEKIKYISKLKGRIGWQGLTSSEYMEEGPYLITGTDFIDGKINWKTCTHISNERWEQAAEIKIKNGDLLITKDGSVGKVAIVDNLTEKASLNSGVLKIILNEKIIQTKYLFWVLLSDVFWHWFALKNAGNSTIIHLYQSDFSEFKFICPTLPEQQAIADYLDDKCAQIDAVVADKQAQLETLAAYKKSLIYEYVTGKKSVPGFEEA